MQNCYICFKLTYESQFFGVSTARRHCVHNRHSCCYVTLFLDRFYAKVIHIDLLRHLVMFRTPTPAGEFDMQVRE